MKAEALNRRSTPEETGRLLQEVRKGSAEAREQLVLENAGLVRSLAARFQARGAEYEDLVQIGYVGLIKAVDRFDPSFQVMFSTYAVPVIMGEIRRYLRDTGRIRMSRRLKQELGRMKKAEDDYIKKNGRSPRISELQKILNCDSQEIVDLMNARSAEQNLCSYEEQIPAICEKTVSAEDNEELRIAKLDLKDRLSHLEKQERDVIFYRYYCDFTQQRTGEILGISQVQVSRIEKRVLARLRKGLSAGTDEFY